MESEFTIILRGFIALALSGMLGWEREAAGKSAGIRTHMLIGLASALFVSLAELLVIEFMEQGEFMQFDPTRILEAVVTGVSFICAGTIFMAGDKQRVKGLTTAAAIPVTAAVGMMVGLDRYLLATAITVMTFMVLYFLGRLTEKYKERHEDHGPRD
jgi:putative Mg2+ transporter-C (MgtC) family protein